MKKVKLFLFSFFCCCICLLHTEDIYAVKPNVVISGPSNVTYDRKLVMKFTATGIPADATVKWEVNKKTLGISSSGADFANLMFQTAGNTSLQDTLHCLVTTDGVTYPYQKIFTITPGVAELTSSFLDIWQGYLRVPANTTITIPEGKQLSIRGYVSFEQGARLVIKKGANVEFTNTCNIVSPQNKWKGIQLDLAAGFDFPANYGFVYKHQDAKLPRNCTGGLAGTESVYFSDGIPVEERQFFWNQTLNGDVKITTPKVFTDFEMVIGPSTKLTIDQMLYMRPNGTIIIKGASSPDKAGGELIMNRYGIGCMYPDKFWNGIKMDLSDGTYNTSFRVVDSPSSSAEIINAACAFNLTGRATANSGYDPIVFESKWMALLNCKQFIKAKNIRFNPNTGFLQTVAGEKDRDYSYTGAYIDLQYVQNFTIDKLYNVYAWAESQTTMIKLKDCTNFSLLNSELRVNYDRVNLYTAIQAENSELNIENCIISDFKLGVSLSNCNRTNLSSNSFFGNTMNLQARGGFSDTRLMLANNRFYHDNENTQSLYFQNVCNLTLFDNQIKSSNSLTKGIYLSYNHPGLNKCVEIVYNTFDFASKIVANGFNKNTKVRCNENISLEITEGKYGYNASDYGLGDQGSLDSPAGNNPIQINNMSNTFRYYTSPNDDYRGYYNVDVYGSPAKPNCSINCTAPYSLAQARSSSFVLDQSYTESAEFRISEDVTSLHPIISETKGLFQVSPNPNNGKIRLQLGSDMEIGEGIKEISVYDLSGNLVHKEKVIKDQTVVEMERSFSPGMYSCILKVNSKVISNATAIVK